MPTATAPHHKIGQQLKARPRKAFSFQIKSIDEDNRIVKGFAATWDPDLVNDKILPGAFAKTIKENGPRKWPDNLVHSEIKLCSQHEKVIGLPYVMQETEEGLYVEAFVAEGTQEGDETWSLVKQGVIDRFSIGYDVVKCTYDSKLGLRLLQEIKLYEFSLVDWPANLGAAVTSYKGLQKAAGDLMRLHGFTPSDIKRLGFLLDILRKDTAGEEGYENAPGEREVAVQAYSICGNSQLPLADEFEEWDPDEAKQSLAEAAGGLEDEEQMNWVLFKKGYVLQKEGTDEQSRDSYVLPFAKVVKGRMVAVPRAFDEIFAELTGGRGKIKLDEDDMKAVQKWAKPYYQRMDQTPPWEESQLPAPTSDKNRNGASATKADEKWEGCGSKSLPLADADTEWSASEAEDKLLGSADDPNWSRYESGHMACDANAKDAKKGYKLPFATFINGKVTAVPKAIFAIAGRLDSTDVPDSVKDDVKTTCKAYYKKMGKPDPWSEDESKQVVRRATREIKSAFREIKSSSMHPRTSDIASRLHNAACVLVGGYGCWDMDNDDPPELDTVDGILELLADITEEFAELRREITDEAVEMKKRGRKMEVKEGRRLSRQTEDHVNATQDHLDEALKCMTKAKERLKSLLAGDEGTEPVKPGEETASQSGTPASPGTTSEQADEQIPGSKGSAAERLAKLNEGLSKYLGPDGK